FSFYCHADRRALHSFPTRRSSDLRTRQRAGGGAGSLMIGSKAFLDDLRRTIADEPPGDGTSLALNMVRSYKRDLYLEFDVRSSNLLTRAVKTHVSDMLAELRLEILHAGAAAYKQPAVRRVLGGAAENRNGPARAGASARASGARVAGHWKRLGRTEWQVRCNGDSQSPRIQWAGGCCRDLCLSRSIASSSSYYPKHQSDLALPPAARSLVSHSNEVSLPRTRVAPARPRC